MIREHLNTLENYQFIIEFKKQAITKRETQISELMNNKSDSSSIPVKSNIEIINSIKKTINAYQEDIMLATYSSGYALPQFKVEFLNSLKTMLPVWKKSSDYVQMVRMLSIAILLEVDKPTFDQLITLVKHDDPEDQLIDTLIHTYEPNWHIHDHFMFAKPYALTKDIIEIGLYDQAEALKKLKLYLKKHWYAGHRDCGWYNAHKSQHNIHTGYWSFESAVLVKILGLDDSSLKNQPYYPYDLVHYTNTPC